MINLQPKKTYYFLALTTHLRFSVETFIYSIQHSHLRERFHAWSQWLASANVSWWQLMEHGRSYSTPLFVAWPKQDGDHVVQDWMGSPLIMKSSNIWNDKIMRYFYSLCLKCQQIQENAENLSCYFCGVCIKP
jgi:hypothetical protein